MNHSNSDKIVHMFKLFVKNPDFSHEFSVVDLSENSIVDRIECFKFTAGDMNFKHKILTFIGLTEIELKMIKAHRRMKE